jgi:hypothetical protein
MGGLDRPEAAAILDRLSPDIGPDHLPGEPARQR